MLKNIKKFIFVITLFVIALAVVGCKDNKAKVNPSVTGSDEVYASITEGSLTYSVTKGKVYSELKASVGVSTLVDLIAKDLLAEYKVSKDDVDAEIKKVVYGTEELEAEEEKDALEDFINSLLEKYGINLVGKSFEEVQADERVRSIYELSLVKKAYAKEQLEKEIKEHNEKYEEYKKALEAEEEIDEDEAVTQPYYLDNEYETYYINNNDNKYWVIVIPFASEREFSIALAQQGIKLEAGKWIKDGKEVDYKEAYVSLYKAMNANVKESDISTEATALTEESKFYYTEADLRSINTGLATRVKENEAGYVTEPAVLNKGSLKVLYYKLSEKLIPEYSELEEKVKAEVIAEAEADFKESELNTSYISTKVYELFKEKGIKIYDTVLSNSYSTTVNSLKVEYKATSEESKTLVASVDGKDYTADQLFAAMDKLSGMTVVLSELSYERFLNNPEINKYYDVKNSKWLDKDMQEKIEDSIDTEKDNFKNGTYVEYGYDPDKMTFAEFIEAVYSAKSEKDLLKLFLYSEIVSNYSSELVDLENDDIWNLIELKMKNAQSEFFSVKGIHILVAAYASTQDLVTGAASLDFEEWSPEQQEKGKELADKIKAFIDAEKGTYQSKLDKIQKAFDACPITKGEATYNGAQVQTVLKSTDGTVEIDMQYYKSLGLNVKYENLGSFKNGKMVKEFDEKVFDLWQKAVTNNTLDTPEVTDAFSTEFGYHVYVNLSNTAASKYTEKDGDNSVDYYTPTREQVKIYVEDEDDIESSELKGIITTYYSPVAKEITGQYLTYVLQYKNLEACLDTLTIKGSYTKEDIKAYMSLNYDKWFENNLSYITKEDLYKDNELIFK